VALLWKMICNLGDPMSLHHPVPCSLSIFLSRTSISCKYRYPHSIKKKNLHTHCGDITCICSVFTFSLSLSLSLSRVPIFYQHELTYLMNVSSHILQIWVHTEEIWRAYVHSFLLDLLSRARACVLSLPQQQTFTSERLCTLSLFPTHTHIHSLSLSLSPHHPPLFPTHTHTHTHTRTHTHTHAHAHTHTNFLFLPHRHARSCFRPLPTSPLCLLHKCDMTHAYVWHDSCIRVTGLLHMRDKTHSHA